MLACYEWSALKTTMSLSMLNFGQQAIFGSALTTIMLMAGHGILEGTAVHTLGNHPFLSPGISKLPSMTIFSWHGN